MLLSSSLWARQARLLLGTDEDGATLGRSTMDAEQDPERLGAVERYGSYARGAVTDVIHQG